MNCDIPKFETQKELFVFLKDNQEDLFYQKKSAVKREDAAISVHNIQLPIKVDAEKSAAVTKDDDTVKIRAIINTTNWMDSHKDVHINGLWKRSLQNNGHQIKMLQEHSMTFDKIIADKGDLDVSTKEYTWKELGYDIPGETEALVFDANVKRERNAFMHKQYKDGNVDNHSVGMQYVKIKLAINDGDEEFKAEKATWDEYFPMIANKAEAQKHGYFFAVLEAKAIEGSAVPVGSNIMTPTLPRKTHVEEEPLQPDSRSLEEKAIINFLKS